MNDTNKIFEAFDFNNGPRHPLYLQEIPKERVIMQSNEIRGINIVYILSLFGPVVVTVYWYYKKRTNG
jgi:hypothetical protein